MAVFRINKTTDYSVMCNRHLKEKEMSLKAKGLLSLMLALPDDWKYSIDGLAMLSKDGKESVMCVLNELEKFGYLIRTRVKDEKGRWGGYDYDIYEQPYTEKPYTENPNTEKPYTENPTQLNTKELSIKEINTNNSNIIAERVLDYLNEKAGTGFKPVESNLKFIVARLKDYSENDLKAVIDKKVKEWKGTKMQAYLRPETLFNATKFESYKNGLSAENKNFRNEREYTAEELNGLIDDVDDIKF